MFILTGQPRLAYDQAAADILAAQAALTAAQASIGLCRLISCLSGASEAPSHHRHHQSRNAGIQLIVS